jgi:TonB-dependent SusC/RagA subfamily outer membrane receptor
MMKTFPQRILHVLFYHFKSISLLLAWLLFSVVSAEAQQGITVKGVVISQTDQAPLSGVAVKEKGTTNGISTDDKGQFVLSNVKPNATLTFSFVGYVTQERVAQAQEAIRVELVADMANLDEVVVVGYGTVRKRDLTGAVSQVNTQKLENEVPAQLTDVLRGNAAGVNVGFSARAKGGGSLQIRGRTSLNAGTSPLIVMDGAIYYGAWEDINPNDIETVDVLKDASSAAVFGAKSATGVIIVTTKKGKEGKPLINISSNVGLATMAVNQKVFDASSFTTWRSDYFRTSNPKAEPYR